MTGRNVKEAAIILGVEGSARQYLRQISKKTGSRQQANLIRIVGHALMQYPRLRERQSTPDGLQQSFVLTTT